MLYVPYDTLMYYWLVKFHIVKVGVLICYHTKGHQVQFAGYKSYGANFLEPMENNFLIASTLLHSIFADRFWQDISSVPVMEFLKSWSCKGTVNNSNKICMCWLASEISPH